MYISICYNTILNEYYKLSTRITIYIKMCLYCKIQNANQLM